MAEGRGPPETVPPDSLASYALGMRACKRLLNVYEFRVVIIISV